MSYTDDTPRGRPVLMRIDKIDLSNEDLQILARAGDLWLFCGEYEGREPDAVDAAAAKKGKGVFQAFAAGSWGRGYWRG